MGKYTKLLMPTVYIGVLGVMIVSVALVVFGVKSYLNEKPVMEFTLDNYFESDISPVVKTESDSIIRPYISETVKLSKYFYDYESDATKQEASIIYYKDTYMQNNGVDYTDSEDFDILAVLDGEVISIEDNEIYGKVMTIKHNDNLEIIYSNITDILVSVGYKVSQGEIIAKTMKSKLNENESLLHFEVYYKGNAIDPEKLYTLAVSELE